MWLCATSNLHLDTEAIFIHSFVPVETKKNRLFYHIERDLFIPFKFPSPLSLSGECFPRLSFHPRQALVSLWGYTLHLSSPGSEEEQEEGKKSNWWLDTGNKNLDNKMVVSSLEYLTSFRITWTKHATVFYPFWEFNLVNMRFYWWLLPCNLIQGTNKINKNKSKIY